MGVSLNRDLGIYVISQSGQLTVVGCQLRGFRLYDLLLLSDNR